MGRKVGAQSWGCAPFLGRGAGFPSSTKWPGLRPTSIPSGILIHSRHGCKIGGLCPLFLGRGAGTHLTQCRLSPTSLPSGILIHPAIWPQQILGEVWGGSVPLWRRGAGSPSSRMWPGPRSTCMSSFTLIHQTAWQQHTNVTDRTDRQTGQRSNSIWRTLLQSVAQKRFALCYRTIVCPVCLSVCDVGVLWPNGWMDQHETWHGGRPRPRPPHCVRWGPSSLRKKGLSLPIFGLCPLGPNGWMD